MNYCYWCLCYSCNRRKCPFAYKLRTKSHNIDICFRSIRNETCPRLECDFFDNKHLRPVLYIDRSKMREKRADLILRLLTDIHKKVTDKD